MKDPKMRMQVSGLRAFSPSRLAAYCFLCLLYLLPIPALPQGVAVTSRESVPSKPLPLGMKAPHVEFIDIAEKAGLQGVSVSGAKERKSYILETTGTGVALFDYDNDGLTDVFFVNADHLDSVSAKPRHYLYRNLGGLRFRDVTTQAGLRHTGWGQGVCAGDIDNDGYVDLFITHWGQDRLFLNQGDGVFRDETETRGLLDPDGRWGTGCAFLDFDRDGDLDLFVAHYVDLDLEKTPKPGELAECRWKGIAVNCGPRGLPGETMSLFENDGTGRFSDVSRKAGVEGPRRYYGFTVLTADFDNDSWVDVYVACDSTASLLYRNNGNGTFTEMGLFAGAAYNEDGQEQAGMGAVTADYDGDGWLDIFKTNFSNDTHTLYRNNGDSTFTDYTVAAGLAANTEYVGWGTAFIDVDRDGWKDIFVTNGHVYPEVDRANIGERFRQPRLLYWNRGDGIFFDLSRQAGPAIQAQHSSRGTAAADLDNDGSMEIVVVNLHEQPSLLKNLAPGGNALLVQAITAEGRDAVGARVTVTAGGHRQIDEVRSGGHHISQGDFRLHFGLGQASTADVEIRWPDGEREAIEGVAANQWVVWQQGKGLVKQRPLARR